VRSVWGTSQLQAEHAAGCEVRSALTSISRIVDECEVAVQERTIGEYIECRAFGAAAHLCRLVSKALFVMWSKGFRSPFKSVGAGTLFI
jgi:hypothetical protein